MNRLFAHGLAAVAVLTLAGCDTITGGPLTSPGQPTATLVIINGSDADLDAVVISECSAMSYGFNRLSDTDYIAPGEARSFTLSAGCWDVGSGQFGGGEAYERMTLDAGDVMQYTLD
jgi:hypothetical protein